ncbi:DNA repair protein RadA [Alicyclobacillus ferrooxydans]|uniref:DNA repair protein RadA n=1 Tax=Alicyclobacillus ferrooxydans TaxID=471514 RepID=A0A0P9EYF5_9BACL|nr:DNA repair protein RadA [Alicyclobacillus ferrooxydans]KPV44177.1 DNA repair protein RadA [Alicyclobacillus ferrooxydans]
MPKSLTRFVCQSCGYESPKWNGRCPQCQEWNTFVEEWSGPASKGMQGSAHGLAGTTRALPITQIPSQQEQRISTGISEYNRVLGGGVVPGSLVLIGGDPGIGKSTLLLQSSYELAKHGHRVLYVSGEESATQLKLRAERLDATHQDLHVLSETDMDHIVMVLEDMKPDFVIIDSIQTVYRPALASAPGSVSQVRECTGVLLRVAKQLNIATFIVGHVTKEGNLAGPRMLEHMVDAVLYFEGDRHHSYRILRAVKNRFGSTNEIAIFEMKEAGLEQVANPSEMFLSERSESAAGSSVVAAVEGSRPILLEVQALVAPTSFVTPRRMTTGADANRVSLILAVLEKRIGLRLQTSDAYVNFAGGVRVDEPAADLGIAIAIASSLRDLPLSSSDVLIGEVGLTGEVRSVSKLEQRIKEADKLGFKRCIVPRHGLRGLKTSGTIEVVGISSVAEAMKLVF